MLRHPTKRELLTYVEGLIDGNVPAHTARHVSACTMCRKEALGMRASLEMVESANVLSPSSELSHRILAEAKRSRPKHTRLKRRVLRVATLFKGAAFAAGLSLIAAVWFNAVLVHRSAAHSGSGVSGPMKTASGAWAKPDELLRTTEELETLASAVTTRGSQPQSHRELHYAKRLAALNAQLTAATAALERNPDSPRANQLVNNGLRRQREALMTYIRERSL